jgi:hypothetical protein
VDGGRARQPGQATGRQGGRGAATRTGDREAGWQGGRGTAGRAWDSTADKRRQHEGQLAAEAAGVGQGTARRHCAEGGLQWHRADESSARQGGRACARDVGWALIGVEVRSQPQRQPQAAELLRATMIAL